MQKIQKFKQGNPETVRRMNEIVEALNTLIAISGDDYVRVTKNSAGTSLGLNINKIIQKVPKNIGKGGGAKLKFAKVIKTLQRADPVEDIEARHYYRIRPLNESYEEYDSAKTYAKDAVVLFSDTKYKAIRDVPKGIEPNNPAYWSELDDLKADVKHTDEDLLYTTPWFMPDEIVQYESADEGEDVDCHLLHTVTNCRKDGHYSFMWCKEKERAMAVF